ncbi:hypothetical protein CspeluHIS016_0114270 [Cutaneotrichosporon spelunceum]|uniref:Brain protein I3 n=1 Tax=Cutaneotrichosporon spelunceum TaxID=1672016 RepID=A0AAD3TQT7_9TREE|nr:hypothetical protein CspeluHIS016_0114270 [Cutaneotrichosporon spelunceum]
MVESHSHATHTHTHLDSGGWHPSHQPVEPQPVQQMQVKPVQKGQQVAETQPAPSFLDDTPGYMPANRQAASIPSTMSKEAPPYYVLPAPPATPTLVYGVPAGAGMAGTNGTTPTYGTQMMKVGEQTYQVVAAPMVNRTICPVTGAQHREESHRGTIGIIIAILCCPIGFIALCLDEKHTCRDCGQVTKQAWGDC